MVAGTPHAMPEALDLSSCFSITPRALDCVLPGFLIGTVGGLVAPGGAGKSMFAVEAGIGVAAAVAGANLLNLDIPHHGPVLILAGEDPNIALHHRLHAMGKRFNAEQRDAIAENLSIIPCVGHGIDIMENKWSDWVMEKARSCRLVVIDTLTRFHGLDENNAADAKKIMGRLERLAHLSGAAILYLHHVSKSAALGGMADLQQAARGSSVFVDNARWLSFLAGMSPDEQKKYGVADDKRRYFVRWNISKENYAGPIEDQWLRRQDGGVLIPTTMEKRATKARDWHMPASIKEADHDNW